MLRVGSDFSGVGAFNQALIRLGVEYKEVFACDMDKFARQTFIHNYGEPEYYPTNVYDREIPSESLDIYMTSPPCQAFSLAGKRLGKDDKRGILFFNSYEFIQVNKPRFFIFENVKGLLSDDGGKTFQEWVNMLGGKSVNGVPVLFPYEESVPYHLYWQVMNAKHHGVPQNRERVFLIGIRDDADNRFQFPREERLTKRLKDVLEDDVDDKYLLSDVKINYLLRHQANKDILKKDIPESSSCIISGYYQTPRDVQYIQIKSATSKGYEEATEGDSINFKNINSETRRGRVGKGVAQTIEANNMSQGVMVVKNGRTEEEKKRRREHKQKTGKDSGTFKDKSLILKEQHYSDTILANANPQKEGLIAQTLDTGCQQGVICSDIFELRTDEGIREFNGDVCGTIRTTGAGGDKHTIQNYRIRRLTPRECFRLMDFPDSFTWPVSDSQAYKQAGNSIVVNVLYKILKNLI